MEQDDMKVMISIPEEFLAEIDRVAAAENRSRSELVREALRQYVELRVRPRRPIDDPRVQEAVASMNALARKAKPGGEDSTDIIRRFRDARE